MALKKKLFFVSVVFLTIFTLQAASSETRKCTVKSMVGSVKIRRASSAVWVDARPKMPLKESDAIRTFVESEAELETSEGTILKLSENSTLEISTLRGDNDKQQTKVNIMSGSLMSNVKKLTSAKSKFEFETPTATAAIRGTIVGFNVSENATQIKVYEGKVLVTPTGSSKGAELHESQMAVVEKGQKEVTIQKLEEKTPTKAKPDSAKADSVKIDSVKIDSAKVDSTSSATVKDTLPTVEKPPVDTVARATTLVKPDTEAILPLKLSITSPTDGASVTPGLQIVVSGTVTPISSSVNVNGHAVTVSSTGVFRTTIVAQSASGDYEIAINAESKGATQSSVRRYAVVASRVLTLVVNSPRDAQVFSKPLIPISGTVTPGAEVTAAGIKLPVTPTGIFNGQVPIADEETEMSIDIEASQDGKTQKVTKRIVYKPEYRFVLQSPLNNQVITSITVPIRGEVYPASSQVTANGRQISVTSTGVFSGMIIIPDQEGEVPIDIEVTSNSQNHSETRTIVYKRATDLNRPSLQGLLPDVAKQSRLTFTVIDRTVEDTITFYKEIDGMREVEKNSPNSPFYVDMQEGVHTYSVWAEDKAKNQTARMSKKVAYLVALWNIRMRKPVGSEVISLPPSSPGSAFKPVYTVLFSIDNLPFDDMGLIREISIQNTVTSELLTQRTFPDNQIECDIGLERNRTNPIVVTVRDINDRIKTQTFNLIIR